MKQRSRARFVVVAFLSGLLTVGLFSACSEQRKQGDPAENTQIENLPLPQGKQALEDSGITVTFSGGTTSAMGRKDLKTDPAVVAERSSPGRQDYLQKKFKSLLMIHVDDTMVVNQPKLATLVLGKDRSIEQLKVEVLDESEAADPVKTDTTLEVGSKMKAKLIPFGSSKAETGFEIEEMGEAVQSFRAERNTIIWQWKITPLNPGLHEMKLSIQVLEKDGEAVSLPARTIPVTIHAKNESFWSKAGDFIDRRAEWLFSIIIIPILIAWFTTRMKNKSDRAKAAQKQPAETA